MPATEVVDLKRQAARLADSVREAGALALSMFKTPLKNWTKGEALSPVSDADIAVDVLLRERLTSDGAAIAWLSEESVDDPARLDARYVWIVDPIDGTRAYIAGLPDWAVSAALVENGRPVAACLYAPVSDEFFFAVAGQGATRNGVAIAATSGAQIEQARIAGPKKFLERVASHRAAVCRHAAHALAGAAPGPDRRGDVRRGHCRRQQPRLGPCSRRPFGARSGRRIDVFRGRHCDL